MRPMSDSDTDPVDQPSPSTWSVAVRGHGSQPGGPAGLQPGVGYGVLGGLGHAFADLRLRQLPGQLSAHLYHWLWVVAKFFSFFKIPLASGPLLKLLVLTRSSPRTLACSRSCIGSAAHGGRGAALGAGHGEPLH